MTSTGLQQHFTALTSALDINSPSLEQVSRWGKHLATVFVSGGRLLACGNGGSAAEAQHLTAELVGRFRAERRPLSAIPLHADTSAGTAIVNDYGADEQFARQVHAHGRAGDVLVCLSTSGTSSNVLAAAKAAHEIGVTTWALTGRPPNPLAALCDDAICVEAPNVATIQEMHLVLVHALCVALDAELGIPS
jgi:D-sedoheptulose 7-phosphate isomerase